MIAIVQFAPDGTATWGAWTRGDDGTGELDVAHRGSQLQLKNGNQAVESQPADESWLDWARQLAQRTPVDSWYEIREVPDGSTAQDVLDAEVKKQFS